MRADVGVVRAHGQAVTPHRLALAVHIAVPAASQLQKGLSWRQARVPLVRDVPKLDDADARAFYTRILKLQPGDSADTAAAAAAATRAPSSNEEEKQQQQQSNNKAATTTTGAAAAQSLRTEPQLSPLGEQALEAFVLSLALARRQPLFAGLPDAKLTQRDAAVPGLHGP